MDVSSASSDGLIPTGMTSSPGSLMLVPADSDKNFVDKHPEATLQQEFPVIEVPQETHSSVYGACLIYKGFLHPIRFRVDRQYTEHTGHHLDFYQLLGTFMRHTRCGRHIAESHKRVQ